jgi:hypothetical protein
MAQALTLRYQFTADTGDFTKGVADARAKLMQLGFDSKTAGSLITKNLGAISTKDGAARLAQLSKQLLAMGIDARTAAAIVSQQLRQVEVQTRSLNDMFRVTRTGIRLLGGGAIGAAASLAIGSALAAAKEYMKYLHEIGDVSKRAYTDPAKLTALTAVGASKGVTGNVVVSGFDALGKKANEEFREGEGELTKLLEANNLKITDRNGKLKSTNDLLMDAARLVADAGTEYDKDKIASLFGLTADWVKILEKGPDELKRAATEAEALGGAIDSGLVARAKLFDDAWDSGWARFVLSSKAAIAETAVGLGGLVDQANRLAAEFMVKFAPLQTTRDQYSQILSNMAGVGEDNKITVNKGTFRTGGGFGAAPFQETVVPKSGSKRGGGDSGPSFDGIERYQQQLEKVRDSLKTQVELWGKSNQEQAVALNLIEAELRAKREGRTLSEKERADVRAVTVTTEGYRKKLKDLKDQQEAVADAARTMGDAVSGALEDMIFNGGKASDVMKRLAQTIATSALRGMLTGEGGFGGLFGTAGKDGKAGGLLGNVFSGLFSGFGGFKAAGGPVTRGKSYVVGENGPEMFMVGENGTIVPNGGGGVTGSGVPIVNVHNYAGANVQVKQSKGPNGPTIDVMLTELVLRDVSQRGPISQALGARRF